MRLAIIATAITLSVCSPVLARSSCHGNGGTYTNSSGQQVPDPACLPKFIHAPGETAICRDGSHSFSKHHSGTCSGHGGVAQWE